VRDPLPEVHGPSRCPPHARTAFRSLREGHSVCFGGWPETNVGRSVDGMSHRVSLAIALLGVALALWVWRAKSPGTEPGGATPTDNAPADTAVRRVGRQPPDRDPVEDPAEGAKAEPLPAEPAIPFAYQRLVRELADCGMRPPEEFSLAAEEWARFEVAWMEMSRDVRRAKARVQKVGEELAGDEMAQGRYQTFVRDQYPESVPKPWRNVPTGVFHITEFVFDHQLGKSVCRQVLIRPERYPRYGDVLNDLSTTMLLRQQVVDHFFAVGCRSR